MISVRGTAFDAVAGEGGQAPIQAIDAATDAGLSEFVGEALAKSVV